MPAAGTVSLGNGGLLSRGPDQPMPKIQPDQKCQRFAKNHVGIEVRLEPFA
jgi:hypothetical protein